MTAAFSLPNQNEVAHTLSHSLKMSSAVASGGFPASAFASSDAPVIASVAANQSICDALLAESAKRDNIYAARAYRNAAVKVAGCSRNLFADSPDGVEDAWVEHHLGEKTSLFVSELVAMTRLKNSYDGGRNLYALFPPEWNALLEDDQRINVAVEVLNDLLDFPLKAESKFHTSPRGSDYAIAYIFYNTYNIYKTNGILVWFYNNIMKMLMNMCG